MVNAVSLPETGYLRLNQIVGNPKAVPPIPPVIPISKASWWAGVKEGRFPKSIKLGPNTTVWRVEDIRALIECTRTRSGECPRDTPISINSTTDGEPPRSCWLKKKLP